MSTNGQTTTPIAHGDCEFCQDHLEEAALHILEHDDLDRVEQHLAACPQCQADLDSLRRVVGLLPFASDDAAPSPDVFEQLQARLTTEVEEKPLVSPQPRSRGFSTWYGTLAAAGLVLAFLFAWTYWLAETPGSQIGGDNVHVLAMNRDCDDCHEDTGGNIGADLEQQDGVVMAWNLDPDEKHEVWCLKRDGSRILVGNLTVGQNGSVVQTMQFPDAVGTYDRIIVQRNDRTQELSVEPVPGDKEESEPTETPSILD